MALKITDAEMQKIIDDMEKNEELDERGKYELKKMKNTLYKREYNKKCHDKSQDRVVLDLSLSRVSVGTFNAIFREFIDAVAPKLEDNLDISIKITEKIS